MVDILAVSAHPDDIEINAAGTIMKALDAGREVGLCDLTEGERGTRGSVEQRRAETAEANRVMGIREGMRWNLGIPDGNIALSQENILKVVRAIRHFRPSVVLFSWERDRHPDHEHGHRLMRQACFDAGLSMVHTEHDGQTQKPHRPTRMYTFFHTYDRTPDFVIDISDYFERKVQAIAAYDSQITFPGRETEAQRAQTPTFISSTDFIEGILARMRHWGFMVGTRYAEAFATVSGPLKINDLLDTV